MRVLPKDDKVIVDGVNVAKKHQKAHPATRQGGIIDKDMPIPVPNVALLSPSDGKPTRVGYQFDDDGTKIRVCRDGSGDLMSDTATATATRRPPQEQYDDEIRAQLKDDARPRQHHGGAPPREDRRQHGRRRRRRPAVAARRRRRRPHRDHRPEAGRHPGQEVDRRLQAPRGQRHRRQGHAAGRPHVGVLRPARHPGDPPHPRLPGPNPRRSTATATTPSASPSS